jgi:3-methyladenine DNA glycosylase/8-oxoguanine DNA glycosylase
VYYLCHNTATILDETLQDFFQLHISLDELQKHWILPLVDGQAKKTLALKERLKDLLKHLHNCRLMRQNPREGFFSFIISQNSNIPRISACVKTLCKEFGTALGEIDGETFYCFPSFTALAEATPAKLKDLGFGYRANYIPKAAQQVISLASKTENLSRYDGS